MRTLLLISVFTVVRTCAEDPSAPTMREKLRAKIRESVPPTPAQQADARKEDEDEVAPAVVMKPMVVSESKIVRDLASAIARERQKIEEEQFLS